MTTTDAGSDAGVDAGQVIADAGTLGDAGTLVGTFQLLHTVSEFGNSSSMFGKVYDGPTPVTVIFTTDVADGDCRVEVPRVPFCATPCGGSAACVEDNVCQPYPTSKSAGVVSLTGALVGGAVTPFDMSPISNGYQAPATTVLSVPPFTDGAPLTVSAAGSSALAPFSVSTQGVAAIALDKTSYDLISGSPLELRWTAGSTSTAARIEVEVDISHHGGLRGQIICDTDDDGSLTIGSALTTRLINLGVSGFPTLVARRVKRGYTVISAGRVDFKATSSEEVGLAIPGLVSCNDDAQCPMGQTCQTDLRCQ